MDLVLGQPTRSAHHRIELFLYYTHLLVDQNHQNLQNIHIAILPNNDKPNNIHSDICSKITSIGVEQPHLTHQTAKYSRGYFV